MIFPDDFWQEMDQPDGSPQGRLRSGYADPKATPAARRVKPASRQARAVNLYIYIIYIYICIITRLTLDGYFNPLVFWCQWDDLRSPAKKLFFLGGAWYLRLALIIKHYIYIYICINVGWVLLAEIKMVIWLMNVDDRFCPILGGG